MEKDGEFHESRFQIQIKKAKINKKAEDDILGQHYQFTQKKVFLFSSGLLQSKSILAR